MGDPLEILPGKFFYHGLEWDYQDPELVDLGVEVMKTNPIQYDTEMCSDGGERMIFAKWRFSTDLGTFDMSVTPKYLYPASHKDFMSRAAHSKVEASKFSNDIDVNIKIVLDA